MKKDKEIAFLKNSDILCEKIVSLANFSFSMKENTVIMEEIIVMKKIMKIITIISILATFLFTTLYITTENRACLSLAITAGTIAYHFLMRDIVAMIVRCVMNNQADLSKWWYRQKRWEKRLYQKLHVK